MAHVILVEPSDERWAVRFDHIRGEITFATGRFIGAAGPPSDLPDVPAGVSIAVESDR